MLSCPHCVITVAMLKPGLSEVMTHTLKSGKRNDMKRYKGGVTSYWVFPTQTRPKIRLRCRGRCEFTSWEHHVTMKKSHDSALCTSFPGETLLVRLPAVILLQGWAAYVPPTLIHSFSRAYYNRISQAACLTYTHWAILGAFQTGLG